MSIDEFFESLRTPRPPSRPPNPRCTLFPGLMRVVVILTACSLRLGKPQLFPYRMLPSKGCAACHLPRQHHTTPCQGSCKRSKYIGVCYPALFPPASKLPQHLLRTDPYFQVANAPYKSTGGAVATALQVGLVWDVVLQGDGPLSVLVGGGAAIPVSRLVPSLDLIDAGLHSRPTVSLFVPCSAHSPYSPSLYLRPLIPPIASPPPTHPLTLPHWHRPHPTSIPPRPRNVLLAGRPPDWLLRRPRKGQRQAWARLLPHSREGKLRMRRGAMGAAGFLAANGPDEVVCLYGGPGGEGVGGRRRAGGEGGGRMRYVWEVARWIGSRLEEAKYGAAVAGLVLACARRSALQELDLRGNLYTPEVGSEPATTHCLQLLANSAHFPSHLCLAAPPTGTIARDIHPAPQLQLDLACTSAA